MKYIRTTVVDITTRPWAYSPHRHFGCTRIMYDHENLSIFIVIIANETYKNIYTQPTPDNYAVEPLQGRRADMHRAEQRVWNNIIQIIGLHSRGKTRASTSIKSRRLKLSFLLLLTMMVIILYNDIIFLARASASKSSHV